MPEGLNQNQRTEPLELKIGGEVYASGRRMEIERIPVNSIEEAQAILGNGVQKVTEADRVAIEKAAEAYGDKAGEELEALLASGEAEVHSYYNEFGAKVNIRALNYSEGNMTITNGVVVEKTNEYNDVPVNPKGKPEENTGNYQTNPAENFESKEKEIKENIAEMVEFFKPEGSDIKEQITEIFETGGIENVEDTENSLIPDIRYLNFRKDITNIEQIQRKFLSSILAPILDRLDKEIQTKDKLLFLVGGLVEDNQNYSDILREEMIKTYFIYKQIVDNFDDSNTDKLKIELINKILKIYEEYLKTIQQNQNFEGFMRDYLSTL